MLTSQVYSYTKVLHFTLTFLLVLKNSNLCKTWDLYIYEKQKAQMLALLYHM